MSSISNGLPLQIMRFFEFFDFCSLVDLVDHIISQVFVRNFRFFSYRIIEFFSNGLKISCIYQNIITCNPRCWVFVVEIFIAFIS